MSISYAVFCLKKKSLYQLWLESLTLLLTQLRMPTSSTLFPYTTLFRSWEKDAGLRIDHLLLSDELKPRLVDAGVDRWVRGLEKPSDHAPTWVTLKA